MSQGKQGQSSATIDKERCIGSALSIGMQIANRAFGGKGFMYWHMDANAGSGWNEHVGVPGSPVVFHKVAQERLTRMQSQSFFCDLDVSCLKQLQQRLSSYNNAHLIPGDNEEAIEVFAERIRMSDRPKFAVGSVVADPNGYWYRNAKGHGAPVRALTAFSREFPCVDIILNLNTNAYKRQVGAGFDVLPPRDVLRSLNKAHWLVRRTVCKGGDFLLAVGRNLKTGNHSSLGFHALESVEGNHIMLRAEGKLQGSLDLDAPIQDLFGISSASGL